MNPWDLLWIILGWVAVVVVLVFLATLILVVVGVVAGLAKGQGSHNIMSSRKLRRKRRD